MTFRLDVTKEHTDDIITTIPTIMASKLAHQSPKHKLISQFSVHKKKKKEKLLNKSPHKFKQDHQRSDFGAFNLYSKCDARFENRVMQILYSHKQFAVLSKIMPETLRVCSADLIFLHVTIGD